MTGLLSWEERLHAAVERRDAHQDALCRELVAVDDATRDIETLLDDRCPTP